MDIGRPNNFPRILDLYKNDYDAVSEVCWGASFSDEETERHMRRVFNETGYVMCPHTAVGDLAMEAFAKDVDREFIKVTVGTAHPAKFADSVERIIREDVPLPAPLDKAMRKKKRVHVMPPSLKALENYLAMHA
jgi:threonine synthase